MADTGKKPLVIIGAGGTGGHMFPAAAFAEEMRARGWAVGLVSDDRGLRYAETFPADWKEEVRAASPSLRKFWMLPIVGFKIGRGISRATAMMRQREPALVAGFGGYPAYPALAAAKHQSVPILIHEQNAVLGRVNRQFALEAGLVASGFERLDRLPKGAKHKAVGNPVRPAIAAMRDTPFPDTSEKLTLFITGGSQGAKILGEAVPQAVISLPEGFRRRIRVVQQVREEQIEDVERMYRGAGVEAELQSFFSDMPQRLAEAHLIIARSGAGTVSEIAAVGRPSILIPLAIAMDDHQTANAEALVAAGAADVVSEKEATAEALAGLILVRLDDVSDLEKRAAAAKAAGLVTAAKDLADIAEKLARK